MAFFDLKLKYSSFTIAHDKEKKQSFTLKKLEPASVWHACLKYDQSLQLHSKLSDTDKQIAI